MQITIYKPTATIPPEALRAAILRRKVQASEAVERLLAELAFGPPADASMWMSSFGREVHANG